MGHRSHVRCVSGAPQGKQRGRPTRAGDASSDADTARVPRRSPVSSTAIPPDHPLSTVGSRGWRPGSGYRCAHAVEGGRKGSAGMHRPAGQARSRSTWHLARRDWVMAGTLRWGAGVNDASPEHQASLASPDCSADLPTDRGDRPSSHAEFWYASGRSNAES